MQQKTWNILRSPEKETRELQEKLGINLNLCGILINRGIKTFAEAKSFFRPVLQSLHSPWQMKGMREAVGRTVKGIERKERILVFGDYDVDGTTSVALAYNVLREIYDDNLLEFYIPHRYKEGYGVSREGIEYAIENNFSLIICLDCGIKSTELISYAAQNKVDFIVCDHHLPGEVLPPAVAILNPKQSGCHYPYKELCGCGIGYKFMCALIEKLQLDKEIVDKHLGLVATAIAADIVPMTGENRILAYYGLAQINEKPLPGISALIKLAAVKLPLSITNVVFVIAPRINAAGRMDDARKAVQLFIEKNTEAAMILAEMLHIDNTDRKEADKSITEEALEMMVNDISFHNQKSSVLYREHWHKGVVGIVASRVIEHHYRPTVVLTLSNGLATGSARSVMGFNLYEAIYECRDLLTAYGGHFAAAGLSMLPENVGPFRSRFEKIVSQTIPQSCLVPVQVIDAEINFSEINETFYNIICQMEPYGPENMRPVFISRNVKDNGYSKIVKEAHIKFVLQQGEKIVSGIGFNLAEKFYLLNDNQPIDVIYTLDENEWNNQKNIQLKVIDVRAAEKILLH